MTEQYNDFSGAGRSTSALITTVNSGWSEILFLCIILHVKFQFYSVSTIGSMDTPYINHLLHVLAQVFGLSTFTCIHVQVFLNWPVVTCWNTGFFSM